MIATFPPLNGPYAKEEDEDNKFVTDYSIGKDVVYAAFSWSLAEMAYEKMKMLAQKYQVGFFDVSANDGDILFPDSKGNNLPIDIPNNLSSIQQIKSSAARGQENASVKEIIYSKLLPQILEQTKANMETKTVSKRKWWQRLFGSNKL